MTVLIVTLPVLAEHEVAHSLQVWAFGSYAAKALVDGLLAAVVYSIVGMIEVTLAYELIARERGLASPPSDGEPCDRPGSPRSPDRHGPPVRRPRGHPRRVRPRARRRVPRDHRRADEGARACSGSRSPRSTAGSDSTCSPTSVSSRSSSYGWMSLVGHRQHAHDRRAPPRSTTAPRRRSRRWLPDLASGELPRLPVAVGVRRRQRHPQHLVPRGARRRGVRHPTAPRCGSRTASAPASSRSRPAPTRASRASSSRRSRGRRSAASR